MGKRFLKRHRSITILLAAMCSLALAENAARAEESLAVRLIDGKLVAHCVIRTGVDAVPANVMIDLGSSASLVLSEKALELLGIDKKARLELAFDADASGSKVGGEGGGGAILSNVRFVSRDLPNLDEFTTEYSEALAEIPVVGTLGIGAFENQVVQLDLAAGKLSFARLEGTEGAGAGVGGGLMPKAGGGITIVRYETSSGGIGSPQLSGRVGGGGKCLVQLSTQRSEAVLNGELLDPAYRVTGATSTAPATQPGASEGLVKGGRGVELVGEGGAVVDLAGYGPVRPYDFDVLMDAQPGFIIGTAILQHFRITLDTANRQMAWEPLDKPENYAAEQALLMALYKGDAPALEGFLASKVKSIFRKEAAIDLLDVRMKAKPIELAAFERALGYFAASTQLDRQSSALVGMADALIKTGEPDRLSAAEKALLMARQTQGKDLNSTASHVISARLGFIALNQKRYPEARKLLLAAAFGMPRDPTVNLWLARLYQETGQPVRAWSRYVEVALTREPPPEAFVGLDDLSRDADFRKKLRMADAELILEGRIPDFAPPRTRRSDEVAPVRLVEFFDEMDRPETLAAELAVHGVERFFNDQPLVFVQYHIDKVLPSPAAKSRAKFYEVFSGPVLIADGQVVSRKGGDKEELAGALFEAYLAGLEAVKPAGGGMLELKGSASLADGVIKAEMTVPTPANTGELRFHALVVERCVFAAGTSGSMLHYWVARDKLSPDEGQLLTADKDSLFKGSLTVAQLQQDVEGAWKARTEANEPWRMRPTLVDLRECRVVGFVQNAETRAILGVISLPITEPVTTRSAEPAVGVRGGGLK